MSNITPGGAWIIMNQHLPRYGISEIICLLLTLTDAAQYHCTAK